MIGTEELINILGPRPFSKSVDYDEFINAAWQNTAAESTTADGEASEGSASADGAGAGGGAAAAAAAMKEVGR